MVISLNQSTPLLRCLLNNTVFVAFSLLNVFLIYKNLKIIFTIKI